MQISDLMSAKAIDHSLEQPSAAKATGAQDSNFSHAFKEHFEAPGNVQRDPLLPEPGRFNVVEGTSGSIIRG